MEKILRENIDKEKVRWMLETALDAKDKIFLVSAISINKMLIHFSSYEITKEPYGEVLRLYTPDLENNQILIVHINIEDIKEMYDLN